MWLQCASRTVLGLVIGTVLLLTVHSKLRRGSQFAYSHLAVTLSSQTPGSFHHRIDWIDLSQKETEIAGSGVWLGEMVGLVQNWPYLCSLIRRGCGMESAAYYYDADLHRDIHTFG